MTAQPKILTYDVETAPMLAYVFGLHKVEIGINQIVEPTRMLSWAAKWHDKPTVLWASEYHHGAEPMVQRLHELLSEADVVVGWNSDSFDNKHARRESMLHDLGIQAPYVSVDLLKVARKTLYLPSYKLDYVAQYLGIGAKLQTGGFQLWRDCLNGDPKAWAKMVKYNKQDVVVTDGILSKLKPYITNLHAGLYGDDELHSCPKCGGTNLQKRGYSYTALSVYQRYQCQQCGGWSRGKTAVKRAEMRAA